MKLIIKNVTLELLHHTTQWQDVVFDSNNRINFYIHSSNVWTVGYSYIIPITSDVKKLKVVANSEKVAGVAFLKSNNAEENVTPDYCQGTSLNIITASSEQVFNNIPDDCNYLYVMSGSTIDANLPDVCQIGE